jgi:uncharacterized protein YjiS (DUF1127 family)
MCAGNESAFYFNNLSSEQWERTRRQIIARAEAARAQALRDLFAAVLYGLRTATGSAAALTRAVGGAVIATAGKWWRAYALWRERRAAVHELHALDDRELKDIGINRSEIEWVVRGQDGTRLRDATIAANRGQRYAMPCSRLPARPRTSTTHVIDKRAA